jgi:RimJ/RimL family protein N-acetyltransferase
MRAHDVDSTREQIEWFESQWAEEGVCHWAADDLETGRLIGRIGLQRHHDWPLEPSPVEVGWVLDERYWGRGLATEGGRASLEVWREQLPDDRRLISITEPANTRSRAVMERVGLTYRGATRWHDHDVVWYAVDREPEPD